MEPFFKLQADNDLYFGGLLNVALSCFDIPVTELLS